MGALEEQREGVHLRSREWDNNKDQARSSGPKPQGLVSPPWAIGATPRKSYASWRDFYRGESVNTIKTQTEELNKMKAETWSKKTTTFYSV